MQYKAIVATVFALVVTSVVAGPVPDVSQDNSLVARDAALVAESVDVPIVARDEQALSANKIEDIKAAAYAFANAHAGQAPTQEQFAQMYNFYNTNAGLPIWDQNTWGNWGFPGGVWPQPVPQVCPPWGYWPWLAYYCQTYWPGQVNIWVNFNQPNQCLLGLLCL